MLVAACLLFILSTMHMVADANHVWQGFISSENADTFFADISKNTFKNAVNELETLVGDAILIYRCYIVLRRIEVTIIPILGWIAIAVTGTFTVWTVSQLPPNGADVVFIQQTRKWATSFYSMALITNFLATSILAFELWIVHRRSLRLRTTGSRAHPILILIMECGALYSMTLVAMLGTYLSASNSAYIVMDMIGQIIPITFCLIIVRTSMLRFSDETSQGLFTHAGESDRLPVARPMKVHIDHMKIDVSDVGKASENSSSHADLIEDTYGSKVYNCP
ncbi:hypothetical protein K503DRAFT_698336 [Rhizopogon vinicolor AM-OR11-026]|uniref:Uncharacterized protein n=1 Tax=Rhizopogon vinicolor AM-OR11-026 TaxID=1314800 RepID=A0A1B7MPY0_9AGAM|nr:hypothetical protein K503DRAFT_698336 [Rhizopogon vinicolor AM-OR11-026]